MVPLLADENFNHRVLRGLRRRLPTIDCLPAQETEVYQRDDQDLLDWAALHNRVVLTHDVNTMTKYAYERLAAGHPLPGVIVVFRIGLIDKERDRHTSLLTGTQLDYNTPRTAPCLNGNRSKERRLIALRSAILRAERRSEVISFLLTSWNGRLPEPCDAAKSIRGLTLQRSTAERSFRLRFQCRKRNSKCWKN